MISNPMSPKKRLKMDDDGGIQWWQQLGAQEIAEYEAWLDEQDRRLLTGDTEDEMDG